MGFVAAGGTANFIGLSQSTNGDDFTQTIAARVCVPTAQNTQCSSSFTPSNDISVSITNKAKHSLDLTVTAPYSTAIKGNHLVFFPNKNTTNLNQTFALVVYDPTPIILSASPSNATANSPTTLTMTLTITAAMNAGFGDHPTVCVNNNTYPCPVGFSYSPGTPTQVAGQDVLTVDNVTLPQSAAGTSIPLYVVSNGATEQADRHSSASCREPGAALPKATRSKLRCLR